MKTTRIDNLKDDGYSTKKVHQIRITEAQKDILDMPYKCSTCGKRYKRQESNFAFSQSALYNGNDHRLNTCNECLDKIFNMYVEKLGDEDEAIKRLCEKFDFYFNDVAWGGARHINAENPKTRVFIKNLNLSQYKGKTYDDYLEEQKQVVIESEDDLIELKNNGTSVTKAMLERWGMGLEAQDILDLEAHYRQLIKQNPNIDSNQAIFIRDLCFTKVLQMKAFKENNSQDYDRASKTYRELWKASGLKVSQEVDDTTDNPLGVNAAIISQYCPEEFYKDKKLYSDFDGMGEYFERHVLRPLRNLEYGETVRDAEFSIGDEDESE